MAIKKEELKNRIQERRIELRSRIKNRFKRDNAKIRKPKKLKHPQWAIKTHKYIKNNKAKSITIFSVIIIGIIALLIVGSTIVTMQPYAIAADNNTLCYVRGKDNAARVIRRVVYEYVPEDTEVKLVESEGRITMDKSEKYFVSSKDVRSVKAAAKILSDYLKNEIDKPLNLSIVSSKTIKEKFTPEPYIKKDKTMLAGESRVAKEGKKGLRYTTIFYTTENGKVTQKEDVYYKVIKSGKRGTVYKGILGLPEGADWKTFDGDPIFKDGDELSVTALKYLGAPYRYGGKSLTNGIDCVAFVVQMYRKYGINLPYSNSKVRKSGVSVSYKNAKKGDIICYGKHMGIYVGDGKMVDAAHGGVKVRRVKTGSVVTVRRIVK